MNQTNGVKIYSQLSIQQLSDSLEQAAKDRANQKPGGFVLICPDGKVYEASTYEEIVARTAHMHRLLRAPSLIGKTGIMKP